MTERKSPYEGVKTGLEPQVDSLFANDAKLAATISMAISMKRMADMAQKAFEEIEQYTSLLQPFTTTKPRRG